MTLTKLTRNDKIEIVNLDAGYPVIQVRKVTIISENGTEISRALHRHVLAPDADLLKEDKDVATIAAVVFTADSKATYANVQNK